MTNTPALPSASTELAAIRDALEVFPNGWQPVFEQVRELEPGIVEIGTLWEDSDDLAGVITVDTGNYYDNAAAMPMAKFIAACNPAAMTAVLAYVDALQAEIQALRADARRYRWLRSYPNNLNAAVYGPTGASPNTGGLLRRDNYLDAAIDAAVSASGEGGQS